MARNNKKATESGGDAPVEKPKRTYTPSDVLSMKIGKRATAIVQALAKHYGKKQGDVLAALALATEEAMVNALRDLQAAYESQSTSAIAGLFDAPSVTPEPEPVMSHEDEELFAE